MSGITGKEETSESGGSADLSLKQRNAYEARNPPIGHFLNMVKLSVHFSESRKLKNTEALQLFLHINLRKQLCVKG
jgi:hypothetical protein